MPENSTAEVIGRFNDAFQQHDATILADLVADDCVMESIQPAPDGTRYEGRDACLAFWRELATDPSSSFDLEDVVVAGDRAVIRWRYRFGDDDASSVRGVNLMQVRQGRIVEALGYAKTPANTPLPTDQPGIAAQRGPRRRRRWPRDRAQPGAGPAGPGSRAGPRR